jgi:RpiB/LacA/LacB family sugar-phosphate isomerase
MVNLYQGEVMQRVVVGSDHVGFPLKEEVKRYLTSLGVDVTDAGTDSNEVPVDYPDYAQKVAWEVVQGNFDSGIVICGTGIGVSMAANKVPGARAALCHDTFTVHQGRAHNDANILALGAWIVSPQRVTGILDEWLKTSFEMGRHVKRVARLNQTIIHPADASEFFKYPSQKFGVSISIKPTSFGPVLFAGRWETGLKALAAKGISCVELSIRHPEDIQTDRLKALLAESGIKVSAIATGQSYFQDGLYLAASQVEKQGQTVERLKSIIDLAASLDAMVILGSVRGGLEGSCSEKQSQRASAVKAISTCVQYAVDCGVTPLLEPINRFETNFINSLAQGLELLDEIGDPRFKLLADTFHMNLEEADISSSLLKANSRIGYIHLADSNRQAPGCGHLDFSAVFNALHTIGYVGPITAEVLPLPDDEVALDNIGSFFARVGRSFDSKTN